MSVRATVLYDAPGPKAIRRNRIYTVLTVLALAAVAWWVLSTLADNGQLTAAKWTPFIQGNTWTTYIIPGLLGTLKAAALSILFAIVFGVIFGLGRLAESKLVRWICGVIIEFFRAIPVLMLMIFLYQFFAVFKIVPPKAVSYTHLRAHETN